MNMINYFYDINKPAPEGELYRYCKDEGLDYQYIVSELNTERGAIIMKIWKARQGIISILSRNSNHRRPDV